MAKHAEAPLGSTCHYFPEGKQQLASEAVRHTGEWVARSLRQELAAGSAAGLRAFLDLWRKVVVESDFHAGCPVLAVAIEEPPADEIPPALASVADVFEQWEALLASSLREHGAGAEQAVQLATLVVAAVEGTVAMCRAKRSTEPLDYTAEPATFLGPRRPHDNGACRCAPTAAGSRRRPQLAAFRWKGAAHRPFRVTGTLQTPPRKLE